MMLPSYLSCARQFLYRRTNSGVCCSAIELVVGVDTNGKITSNLYTRGSNIAPLRAPRRAETRFGSET